MYTQWCNMLLNGTLFGFCGEFICALMLVKSQWGINKRGIKQHGCVCHKMGRDPGAGNHSESLPPSPCADPARLQPVQLSICQEAVGLLFDFNVDHIGEAMGPLVGHSSDEDSRHCCVIITNATSAQAVRHQLIPHDGGFVLTAEKVTIDENHYVLKNFMDQDYIYNHKITCQSPVLGIKSSSNRPAISKYQPPSAAVGQIWLWRPWTQWDGFDKEGLTKPVLSTEYLLPENARSLWEVVIGNHNYRLKPTVLRYWDLHSSDLVLCVNIHN